MVEPPCGAASGFGSIWVAVYGTGRLVRIDPVLNRVIDVIHAGDGAFSIAVAGGHLWVTNFAGSDVWRFAGS